MSRGGVAVGIGIVVVLSCAGQTTEDDAPSFVDRQDASSGASGRGGSSGGEAAGSGGGQVPSDAPLDPPDSVDVSAPPADATPDASTADAETPDVSASDASDALDGEAFDASACEPPPDSTLGCGAVQCVGSAYLAVWSTEDGGCCVKTRYCPYGCFGAPGSADCAAPPPECESGHVYAAGVGCAFQVNSLCFDTFEQACACRKCSAEKPCATVDGLLPKLKLPKKPDFTLPCPLCASNEYTGPPPLLTTRVVCAAPASDAGDAGAESD